MVEFATKFMQPVVSKLDPTMIHWSSSLLQVAVHYATRLLDLREAVPEPFDKKDVTGLPTALVERYPAHGCVISRAEARQLGLPVFDLESYDRGADAIATHRRLEARHSNFVQILPLDAPDGQDADEDG